VSNAVGLLILLKLCPIFTFLQQLMTKIVSYLHIHLFSNVLHRRRRISPRRAESSECVSNTEVWNAIAPGRFDFLAGNINIHSRRVRTILENSRQNPKISKISDFCIDSNVTFHSKVTSVFADSRIALLCRALRICVAHAPTESCPFSLLVH